MKHMYRLLLYINLMCFFIAQTTPISPVRKLINWARYGSETGRMADVVAHLKRNWGKYAALTAAVVAVTQRKRIADAGRRLWTREKPSQTGVLDEAKASAPRGLETGNSATPNIITCTTTQEIFQRIYSLNDGAKITVQFTPDGGPESTWIASPNRPNNMVDLTNKNINDANAPHEIFVNPYRVQVAKQWWIDRSGNVSRIFSLLPPQLPTTPIECKNNQELYKTAACWPDAAIEITVRHSTGTTSLWKAMYESTTRTVVVRCTHQNQFDFYVPVDKEGVPAEEWCIDRNGNVTITHIIEGEWPDLRTLNAGDFYNELARLEVNHAFLGQHPISGKPWPYQVTAIQETLKVFGLLSMLQITIKPFHDPATPLRPTYTISAPNPLRLLSAATTLFT